MGVGIYYNYSPAGATSGTTVKLALLYLRKQL
jgi:hypothetical protein